MSITQADVYLNLVRPVREVQPFSLGRDEVGGSWIKFSRLSLKAFLVAGDLAVCGVAVASYTLLWGGLLPNAIGAYALLAVATLLGLYLVEGYEPAALRSSSGLPTRVLMGLALSAMLLGAAAFALPPLEMTPRFVACLFVVLVPGIFAWRLDGTELLRRSLPRRRVAVVGNGHAAQELIEAFEDYEGYELRMVVVASEGGLLVRRGDTPTSKLKYAALPELLSRESIELAAVALPEENPGRLVHELVGCRYHGIEVENAANCLELLRQRVPVRYLEEAWVAFSSGFVGWDRDFAQKQKRLLDIGFSLSGLVLGLPVLVLVALAIRLTSRGPVLYRQTRVGKGGREFTLIKFRSMRTDAESGNPIWAREHDSRITLVGNLLRKSHLDEAPQLWNILRGDMSLVGPRPERPEFVQGLREQIPYYDLRHLIRPGLTGWAQIQYPYGASVQDSEAKLEYDLYYVRHKHVFWDLRIILRTATVCFLGRGAR